MCSLGYTGDPCIKCATGTYKDKTGPSACYPCSRGSEMTTNFKGATQKEDCEHSLFLLILE